MPNRKLPPDQQVIDLYISGKSSGEIAEILGNVSPITVIGLLRRLGVKRRTPNEYCEIRTKSGRANSAKYWLGKKQSPEMVEKRVSKIRGKRHYLWKGGKDSRQYRRIKNRDFCSNCDSRLNLGIHHIDFDHYNDNPDNLQVLCVSCHMSLHKKVYWDCVHDGKIPPKSNGRVGWTKGGDD